MLAPAERLVRRVFLDSSPVQHRGQVVLGRGVSGQQDLVATERRSDGLGLRTVGGREFDAISNSQWELDAGRVNGVGDDERFDHRSPNVIGSFSLHVHGGPVIHRIDGERLMIGAAAHARSGATAASSANTDWRSPESVQCRYLESVSGMGR